MSPRTPDPVGEELNLVDLGQDPSGVGAIANNGGDLKAQDQFGIFNLRQGAASDIKDAKVSSDDTTPGFLEAKIVAGSGVTIATLNPGANETLEISSTGGTGVLCHLILATSGGVVYDNGGEIILKENP